MTRRVRWWGPVVAAVLLAGAVVAGGWWAGRLVPDGVAAGPLAVPGVEVSAPGVPSSGGGGRLRVPAVGLDAELREMAVGSSRVVDPPSEDAAYLLADHGVAPSRAGEGTVFVAMHALNAGGAPGNALTGPDGMIRLAPGDVVEVDGVAFTVERVYVAGKGEVAADADLWDSAVPGRLVVVTCLPVAGRAVAVENVVVVGWSPISE